MCPACENKRLHGPDEWQHHPYAHHGFNGTVWTHPDLAPHDGAGTGAADLAGESRGRQTVAEAAPAGGEVCPENPSTTVTGDQAE
jgi:hypothetical protein